MKNGQKQQKWIDGFQPGFVNITGLKQRGWTNGLIEKLLGDCDCLAPNPKYRRAAPMRMYDIKRVEEAECSPDFINKPSNKSRRIGAVKAVQTKTENIRKWALTIPIKYSFPSSVNTAIRRGRETAYQRFNPTDERAAVNYLRHRCTTYDAHLAKSFGVVGTNLAHAIIKNRILKEIASTFPELVDETERQMINETGLEPPSVRNITDK